jgi:hypothetical protein
LGAVKVFLQFHPIVCGEDVVDGYYLLLLYLIELDLPANELRAVEIIHMPAVNNVEVQALLSVTFGRTFLRCGSQNRHQAGYCCYEYSFHA